MRRFVALVRCAVAARRELRGRRLAGVCMSFGLGLSLGIVASDTAGAPTPQQVRPTQLDDPYPAVWIDSSALLATRFGEVQFAARDGMRMSAFVYRATRFEARGGPVWFVMHGAKRGARGYLRAAAPVAERHDALAIAIEFPKQTYPKIEDYTLGVMERGEAGGSASAEKRWRQPESYVYSEVEHVFEAVRRLLGGHQEGYYLFGHSAGGQFVHRLLTFLPNARVLGAVAANAGWYTLPVAGDDAQFSMPYGLRGTPLERAELPWLYAAPLTVMLGASDTAGPDADELLRGTPEAMAQGATRLARGQNYFATARTAASKIAAPFNWRLAVVPHAGHDVTQVMASAEFFLFESGEPCVPTAAASGGPVVINEVLADPPNGARGDANADGVRDSSDDEFVELVNAGQTPVCMTGWTLGDASDTQRHVFPLGAPLLPGEALVVFGGGVPTGAFGGAHVQWAAFGGRLDLSNAGDVLTLRDAAGTVVNQFSWGDCAGQACARDHRAGGLGFASSLVRAPEITGGWAVHEEVAGSDFSPGVRADRSLFGARDPRMRTDTSAAGGPHEQ